MKELLLACFENVTRFNCTTCHHYDHQFILDIATVLSFFCCFLLDLDEMLVMPNYNELV